MASDLGAYKLFKEFIDTYFPLGFKGIDGDSALLQQLEAATEANNQFFHVANLIQAKITWASKRCEVMMGIKPEDLDAYHFMDATHPDDVRKAYPGKV